MRVYVNDKDILVFSHTNNSNSMWDRYSISMFFDPGLDRWNVFSSGPAPDHCWEQKWGWETGLKEMNQAERKFCENFRVNNCPKIMD